MTRTFIFGSVPDYMKSSITPVTVIKPHHVVVHNDCVLSLACQPVFIFFDWRHRTSCLGIRCSGKCPTPLGFAVLIPCTKVSIVLHECTSAVGLTKKQSTTETSFRAKNLDATCDGAASCVFHDMFHGIFSSSIRVLCLSLLSFRIVQSLQDLLLVCLSCHSNIVWSNLVGFNLKNFFITLVVWVVISTLRCGLKGGLLSRDPDQSQINRLVYWCLLSSK